MRISDWSSDVCSSDLAPPCWQRHGRKAARPTSGLPPHCPDQAYSLAAHWRTDSGASVSHPLVGPWSRRYIAARRDRKSVVQGKSVSVRVDLGGRRIIKKKKKLSTSINLTKNKL